MKITEFQMYTIHIVAEPLCTEAYMGNVAR